MNGYELLDAVIDNARINDHYGASFNGAVAELEDYALSVYNVDIDKKEANKVIDIFNSNLNDEGCFSMNIDVIQDLLSIELTGKPKAKELEEQYYNGKFSYNEHFGSNLFKVHYTGRD